MENACSACIGQGFSPPSNGVMLSTANRNFAGRSGTESAAVHLVSPVTAAASAVMGCITDPRDLFKGDLAFKQAPPVVDMGAYTPPLLGGLKPWPIHAEQAFSIMRTPAA